MQTMTSISHDLVVMALKVDWKALGGPPEAGDIWLGNLLRCVGKEKPAAILHGQRRGQGTQFHVPEKFGEFRFVE